MRHEINLLKPFDHMRFREKLRVAGTVFLLTAGSMLVLWLWPASW